MIAHERIAHEQASELRKKLEGFLAPTSLEVADKTQIISAFFDAAYDTFSNFDKQYESEIDTARKKEQELQDKIKEFEAAERDLQSGGFVGTCLRLLRGAQRLVWGYSVLIIDFMVFSGTWKISTFVQEFGAGTNSHEVVGENIISAFWIINLLVLSVLFGERAIINLLPIIRGIRTGQTGLTSSKST